MTHHTNLPPKKKTKINWKEVDKLTKDLRKMVDDYVGKWKDTPAGEFLEYRYNRSFDQMPIEMKIDVLADALESLLVELKK